MGGSLLCRAGLGAHNGGALIMGKNTRKGQGGRELQGVQVIALPRAFNNGMAAGNW